MLYKPPPSEQTLGSFLPGRYIGFSVARYFASRFTYLSEEEWIRSICAGRITVNGSPTSPKHILKEHDYIVANLGVREEPAANRTLQIIFEDEHIRIFNKVSPIPIHPCGRFFKNSMTEVLKDAFPKEVPRPAQRLDISTTGVLVFARTRKAAAFLMNEFSSQNVYKEYHVIVEGIPRHNFFVIDAPISKIKKSRWGISKKEHSHKSALTTFELIGSSEGLSLLKAVPRSGRTNQIRIHLQHIGLPVWNDPIYGNGKEDPATEMGLHAYCLGFQHTKGLKFFTASWPSHFQKLLCFL